MFKRLAFIELFVIMTSTGALAQYVLPTECNDRPLGQDWSFSTVTGRVLILQPGLFHFDARDAGQVVDIRSIVIDSSVASSVSIIVASCDLSSAGADNVHQIDLSHDVNDTWTATLKELQIDGDLGDPGLGAAIIADQLGETETDEISVGGSVLTDVDVKGDVVCDVCVGGDIDGIFGASGTLAGTLTVAGDIQEIIIGDGVGETGGVVTQGGGRLFEGYFGAQVGQALWGDISISGDVECLWIACDLFGNVTIEGDLTPFTTTGIPYLKVSNQMPDSVITIQGNVVLPATITKDCDWFGSSVEIWGDLETSTRFETNRCLWGNLHIAGNAAGDIQIGDSEYDALLGTIVIDGDLIGDIAVGGELYDETEDLTGGHIIVNGSLVSNSYPDPEIHIAEGMVGSTEFVAIDYDGWDQTDTWQEDAYIFLAATNYSENTPAEHLWEISECRGDMTGDWAVNGFDINPFLEALGEGAPYDDYALAYPGLVGSIVFHGDCNCDGYFNGFDIDPFVDLMLSGTCSPDCGGRGGDGKGDDDGPEAAARLLLAYTAPENFPTLILTIDELIAAYGKSDRGLYWQTVQEILLK